jgi:hypothetical protein
MNGGMGYQERNGAGPSVLRFEARLFQHPQTAKAGSKVFLTVPKRVAGQFSSRGATKVEGVMNGQPFRAVLEPDPSGGHWLHVNKAMRRGAASDVGDTVQLAILGPEPEPTLPEDFRIALTASDDAEALWKDLTLMGRLDWVRWIEAARKPETRVRRIRRAVEQLSSGDRRACCVNVYEFMLDRIREDEQARES